MLCAEETKQKITKPHLYI